MPQDQRPYRAIADKLARRIKKETYPIGSRLPAERTLAEELKISRPVVREAIIALEMMGLVEVKPGSGIYVRNNKEIAVETEKPSKVSIFDLLEARKVIEANITALAANSINKAQLKRLQKANKKLEASLENSGTFEEADREFHSIIAEASQNSVLEGTVSNLWQHRLESDLWRILEEKVGAKKLRKTAVKDHNSIIKALESGKAGKASKAMNKHLDKMIELILSDLSDESISSQRLLKAVA